MGACVFKANGQELVFYMTPYSREGKIDYGGELSRYYTATSDYGLYDNGNFKGYWNRSVQMRFEPKIGYYINNHSWQWDGLPIRPILNED